LVVYKCTYHLVSFENHQFSSSKAGDMCHISSEAESRTENNELPSRLTQYTSFYSRVVEDRYQLFLLSCSY